MKCSSSLLLPLLDLSITGRLLLCEGIMWQSPPALMAAVQFGRSQTVAPNDLTDVDEIMEDDDQG